MKTTLNEIKKHKPCSRGWRKLLRNLGKTQADGEPLKITTILDSNGLKDALWCLRAVDERVLLSSLVPIYTTFHLFSARRRNPDLLRIVCTEIEQRP